VLAGTHRCTAAHQGEIVRQPVGALVTVVRLLLQQPHDDRRQAGRHRRVHGRRRSRHPGEMVMQDPQRVARPERRRPGSQLVQRRPERVQVSPLVDRPASPASQLRREIGQRADDLAVGREPRLDGRERRGHREVNQTGHVPVAAHHDVRRTDIPVHHTPPMHTSHGARQRSSQVDQLGRIQRHGPLGQRSATDIDQQDRPSRRRHASRHLHDPLDPGQPLEDLDLMPQPPLRVRPQRLLPDHGPDVGHQPSDPSPLRLVKHRHPRRPRRIPAQCRSL